MTTLNIAEIKKTFRETPFEQVEVAFSTGLGPKTLKAVSFKGLCYHQQILKEPLKSGELPHWNVSQISSGLAIPLNCRTEIQAALFLVKISNLADWAAFIGTEGSLSKSLVRIIKQEFKQVRFELPDTLEPDTSLQDWLAEEKAAHE